jgi:hypothetical protein
MGMTRRFSALAAAAVCAGVCAGPASAATSHASTATQLCSKVSASSVSSIVGYKVPAAVGETLSNKPTKANDDIGDTDLYCAFGAQKSLASLKKSVGLSVETLTRAPSAAEFKKLLEKAHTIPGLKVKLAPYPGLGSEAFLLTFSEAGITSETLAVGSGTKLYAASVDTSTSTSKLASLVKLAEKL